VPIALPTTREGAGGYERELLLALHGALLRANVKVASKKHALVLCSLYLAVGAALLVLSGLLSAIATS
jgi:hypothetical protein